MGALVSVTSAVSLLSFCIAMLPSSPCHLVTQAILMENHTGEADALLAAGLNILIVVK